MSCRHYTEPCKCSVCGGDGMTTEYAANTSWLYGGLRHVDPEVCARVLRRRAEELEQRERELREREGTDG